MKRHPVRFFPVGREIAVEEGLSLLEAIRRAGLFFRSECNGGGRCGSCRVQILQGEVGPLREEEIKLLTEAERREGFRLACRTELRGEADVYLPEDHLWDLTVKEKGFQADSIPLRPAVKEYTVEGAVFPDSLKTVSALCRTLEDRYGLKDLIFDPSLRETLSAGPAAEDGRMTARVWMDREVISLSPGGRRGSLGLALDLGTTTVAVYLWDLQRGEALVQGAFTNPMVRFGPDVLSRIHWSVKHPGRGSEEMRRELVEALNKFLRQTARRMGFSLQEVADALAVGNPVMHHLFLGIPPDSLGRAPFKPLLSEPVNRKAGSLGLDILPTAYVHLLPLIGGFVGSDTTAVLLAERPHGREHPMLILDLGTNGEIVLGNRERLMVCSCATGPAFEGAQLSCGMRAVPGAVERVRLDPRTLEPDYRVVGRKEWAHELPPGGLRPTGICGSGVVDLLAHMLTCGLVERDGAFTDTPRTRRLRRNAAGEQEFLLVPGTETGTGRDIVLTQKDIRQVQLAKAAVWAGCLVLLVRFGLSAVQRIHIAGAFGEHLDPETARTLGLFPSFPEAEIVTVGNAAGHGACLALLDREKRKEAETVARQVEHIELASDPLFQKAFLGALNFPDKDRSGFPLESLPFLI